MPEHTRPPIIVTDLDGTLADCEHRQHLVREEPKRWKEFFEACTADLLNEPVAHLLSRYDHDHEIIIFTGRNEDVRPQTEDWLTEHGVVYHQLHMRPSKDFSPDEDLKARWVHDKYIIPNLEDIRFILEDRAKVVAMWRRMGLTCFQVDHGDF